MSKIKTLDEILAGMERSMPAKSSSKDKKSQHLHQPSFNAPNPKKTSKAPKKLLPKKTTITPPDSPTHTKDKELINILSKVGNEPLMTNDKTINRLRWLAFYYLSRRELSQKELRKKLLDKDQDPKMVEELLVEFAQKGYQSDERCTYMLIREALRKGRGKQYILQSFYKHGITPHLPLDELIKNADIDSLVDGTILDDSNNQQTKENIDWKKLAVEARTKKYGHFIPKDPKEKAKQLRFLQYRGFSMEVSLEALSMTLEDFDDSQ